MPLYVYINWMWQLLCSFWHLDIFRFSHLVCCPVRFWCIMLSCMIYYVHCCWYERWSAFTVTSALSSGWHWPFIVALDLAKVFGEWQNFWMNQHCCANWSSASKLPAWNKIGRGADEMQKAQQYTRFDRIVGHETHPFQGVKLTHYIYWRQVFGLNIRVRESDKRHISWKLLGAVLPIQMQFRAINYDHRPELFRFSYFTLCFARRI